MGYLRFHEGGSSASGEGDVHTELPFSALIREGHVIKGGVYLISYSNTNCYCECMVAAGVDEVARFEYRYGAFQTIYLLENSSGLWGTQMTTGSGKINPYQNNLELQLQGETRLSISKTYLVKGYNVSNSGGFYNFTYKSHNIYYFENTPNTIELSIYEDGRLIAHGTGVLFSNNNIWILVNSGSYLYGGQKYTLKSIDSNIDGLYRVKGPDTCIPKTVNPSFTFEKV